MVAKRKARNGRWMCVKESCDGRDKVGGSQKRNRLLACACAGSLDATTHESSLASTSLLRFLPCVAGTRCQA